MTALYPQTEVLGQSILNDIKALGRRAQPILARYGIQNPDPNAWYSQQEWVATLCEISQEAALDLMSVGRRIADTIRMPDGVYSIPNVLHVVEETYRRTHRNAEPMRLSVEVIDDHTLRIVDRSPYPDELQYGLLFGLLSRLIPLGANLTLRYTESDAENATVYIASW